MSTEDANGHSFLKSVLPKLPVGVLALVALSQLMVPWPVGVTIAAILVLKVQPILAEVAKRYLGASALACGVIGFTACGPYGCFAVAAGPFVGFLGVYWLLVEMKKRGHISDEEFKTRMGCLLDGIDGLSRGLPVPTPTLAPALRQQTASQPPADTIEQPPKEPPPAKPIPPVPGDNRRIPDASPTPGASGVN